jgi:hypothetical protein
MTNRAKRRKTEGGRRKTDAWTGLTTPSDQDGDYQAVHRDD